jgi:hypothetical protein
MNGMSLYQRGAAQNLPGRALNGIGIRFYISRRYLQSRFGDAWSGTRELRAPPSQQTPRSGHSQNLREAARLHFHQKPLR